MAHSPAAPEPPARGLHTVTLAWRAGVAVCALLAAVNLLAGISGGLGRLGFPAGTAAIGMHGAVMVCGFFGTLIALERAVALRHLPGLLAPLSAGVGGVLAWLMLASTAAQVAWALAGCVLAGLYLLAGATRAWSTHLLVELAGALCWVAGTAAWVRGDLAAGLAGWMAFLVLTIAGERRELTQMMRLPDVAHRLFHLSVALILLAVALAVASAFGAQSGAMAAIVWSIGCVLLALWLLRWDIAPRKWRSPAWLGHTAQCLTVGYLWLLIGALLGLAGIWWHGAVTGLALHAVLLGFVFAMVFGHAPIILPALAGVRPVYSPWARAPIWILSASLLLRGVALATGSSHALAIAGAGHALAIAWFAVVMLRAALRGLRKSM